MPSSAQTFNVLKAIQSFLDTDLLVSAASPFSTFTPADQTTYGATHVIYPGMPKDMNINYPKQCLLVPVRETVERRAMGGKVWDELYVHVTFAFLSTQNWYTAFQNLCAARDAAHILFAKHAELPNLPIVAASKIQEISQAPSGYFIDQQLGRDWQCWGFTWWVKSEYNVGTIVS
jgi:hypothetical protein